MDLSLVSLFQSLGFEHVSLLILATLMAFKKTNMVIVLGVAAFTQFIILDYFMSEGSVIYQAVIQTSFAGLIAFWFADYYKETRNTVALYVAVICLITLGILFVRAVLASFTGNEIALYSPIQITLTELLKFLSMMAMALVAFTKDNKSLIGYARNRTSKFNWHRLLRSIPNIRGHKK